MARPSSLTPAITEKVCEALALGVSWEAAAAHAGITATTIHRWIAQADDDAEVCVFREFREQTTRARDAAEVRMASIVIQAAEGGDAKAAQWWLERRRSASWGRQDSMAVTVEKADPAAVLAAALTKLEPNSGVDP